MTAPPLDPTGADRRLRVVYCAVPDRALAQELARAAVGKRLAACANFWPLRSVYWWRGRVEESDEHALLLKTSAKKVGELFEFLAARHPYEVPDIHELHAPRVHEPFVRWLFDAIDPRSAEPPEPRARPSGSPKGRAAPSRRRTRARRRPR
jgi:periplasmic divalent cation tolerance protein